MITANRGTAPRVGMIASAVLAGFLPGVSPALAQAEDASPSPNVVIDVSLLQSPPSLGAIGEAAFDVAPAPDDPAAPELNGAAILENVAEIVGFSQRDQQSGSQFWGRISGRPAAAEAARWVGEQFQAAGLENVEVQEFSASEDMWFPHRWRVLVNLNAENGGADARALGSAVPTYGSFILGERLEAPLVYVGPAASRADPDVSGMIAVQSVRPERSAYTARTLMRESAQALINDGALAVINVVEQAGNMHVYDFGGCGGPCFNIGGADGAWLIEHIAEAAPGEVRASMTLDAENLSGLTAHNVVGVLPGESNEVVIVNAHLDGWFDGAGDNADGLATLIALARHYGSAETPPARTMVFVASAGHHSRGLNGASNFVAMNPDLAERAVLVLNLEHVAQYEIDAVTWEVYPREQPMSFGISNMAPFLVQTAREAQAATGFALIEEYREAVPGDLRGYEPLGVPRVQAIHSGALYHTSGDVLETISVEGLTRAAHFYRRFLDAVLAADVGELDP
ncbi:MAG: M28 family peptidase [Maricaulaceae bacterium]|jgi:hypothetical protein